MTPDFEVISVDPPSRWAIQIRPGTCSLSSTFPWKSIHLYSFTHLLPAPIHLPFTYHLGVPAAWYPSEGPPPPINNFHILIGSIPLVLVSIPSPSHTLLGMGLSNTSPGKRKKKKKPKWLSISFCWAMRIMVSQMNSVQEPSLIEKTQAWSAMKEMVLVSQLNCVNVLSRAGEGGGEENTKKHEIEERHQTGKWNYQMKVQKIKWTNWKHCG